MAVALTLFGYGVANADILYLKDGKTRFSISCEEITLKSEDIDSEGIRIRTQFQNKEYVIGHKPYEQLKDQNMRLTKEEIVGIEMDGKNAKIWLKNYLGYFYGYDLKLTFGKQDKTIRQEDIKKYIPTNNVIPDEDIIERYKLIDLVNKYSEKIYLFPGPTFNTYRDDITKQYSLSAVRNLELLEDLNYLNHRYRSSNREELKSIEQKLITQGFDTELAEVVTAGSELTPETAKWSYARFIRVLFHERWHENSGVQYSANIDESIASVIGQICAEQFIKDTYGPYSEEMKDLNQMKEELMKKGSIILECYNTLSDIYKMDLPDEEKLTAKDKFLEEIKQKTGYTFNNISLSTRNPYFKHYNFVNEVIQSFENLEDAIRALKKLGQYNTEKEAVDYLKKLLENNS